MPDDFFTDPRMAALYEPLNPHDRDTDFYLELAGISPVKILDVGCGSGVLTRALADRGHHVVGADPAAAMLAVARQAPGGNLVTWVEQDVADLKLSERFDLAVMNGHVFQVFTDDETVHKALTTIRRHLAPGGRLGFESRNPAARAWEGWIEEKTRAVVVQDDGGEVEVFHELQEVTDELVTFVTHVRFPDGLELLSSSTLRFMSQEAIQEHLLAAGFSRLTWYGDWTKDAFRPTSPEIICIAS